MATLDLSRATKAINLLDPNIVSFGTAELTTSDTWSFKTPTGDDLQLEGKGMTFDKAGHAKKGTVHTIGIDLLNNDFDNPDILITGLNAKAAKLDDGRTAFWQNVLEGNDTIIGTSNGSRGSLIFGDGPSARHKAIGGNDLIKLGTDGATVAGDVWEVGSQASPTKVKYTGGHDQILVHALDTSTIAGDARFVYGKGTLIGGNDTILLLGGVSLAPTMLAGDASVVGDGAVGQLATVIGGNDTLTAGDDSFAILIGDVERQAANSFVRGGNDLLSGGSGADVLIGDVGDIGDNHMVGGNDLLKGNGGQDILYGDFAEAPAMGTADAGDDTLYGGSDADILIGDGGDDTKATGGNDKLYGEAGADQLFGGTGSDTLDGGYGNDILRGGTGDDVYVANEAGDSILEFEGNGIDTVFTSRTSIQIVGNVENLTYTGDKNFLGSGNTLANVIKGASGADVLQGGDGADQLHGGAQYDELYGGNQDDVLIGGSGADLLHGGDGFDIASYAGSETAVSVTLNGSLAATGDAIGDVFVLVEGLTGTRYNDILVGDTNFNRLEGGRGSDLLSGLGGTDVLLGGLGRDSLTGGADSDRFVFTDIADSGLRTSTRDVIVDFIQGQDLIDLSAIDANARKAGDQTFKFLKVGKQASDVGTGKIGWYFENKPGAENDYTILKINNDADAAVDMTIALKGIHTLTAADFVL